MDPQWVKIRSWHVLLTWTRVPGVAMTRCGRRATGVAVDERPGNEPTCESCLRIIAPK